MIAPTGHRAWEAALDELEAAAGDSWTAPTDLGPMPADLFGRASVLLAELEARGLELGARRDEVRDELAALRRRGHVAVAPAGHRAAGLDTIA